MEQAICMTALRGTGRVPAAPTRGPSAPGMRRPPRPTDRPTDQPTDRRTNPGRLAPAGHGRPACRARLAGLPRGEHPSLLAAPALALARPGWRQSAQMMRLLQQAQHSTAQHTSRAPHTTRAPRLAGRVLT